MKERIDCCNIVNILSGWWSSIQVLVLHLDYFEAAVEATKAVEEETDIDDQVVWRILLLKHQFKEDTKKRKVKLKNNLI